MALLYIVSIPAVWALATAPLTEAASTPADCGNPAHYKQLAALKSGRILAPIDLGPFLLAETSHSVFGAPYHRDVDGMHYVFATLYETPARALPLLHEKKVDYIVLCDQLGEQNVIEQQNTKSLGALLMKGEAVKGLEKLDMKAPMHVWRAR